MLFVLTVDKLCAKNLTVRMSHIFTYPENFLTSLGCSILCTTQFYELPEEFIGDEKPISVVVNQLHKDAKSPNARHSHPTFHGAGVCGKIRNQSHLPLCTESPKKGLRETPPRPGADSRNLCKAFPGSLQCILKICGSHCVRGSRVEIKLPPHLVQVQ